MEDLTPWPNNPLTQRLMPSTPARRGRRVRARGRRRGADAIVEMDMLTNTALPPHPAFCEPLLFLKSPLIRCYGRRFEGRETPTLIDLAV